MALPGPDQRDYSGSGRFGLYSQDHKSLRLQLFGPEFSTSALRLGRLFSVAGRHVAVALRNELTGVIMTEVYREAVEQMAARSERLLLFLGGALTFPPQLLSLIGSEIEGVALMRCDPRAFETLGELRPNCTVIFEDSIAARILAGSGWRGCGMSVHAYRDEDLARRLLAGEGGADPGGSICFLPLRMPVSSFVALLRILLAGDEVLPRDLIRAPPKPADPAPAALPDPSQIRLTPREAEVLALVASGQRNKLIARRLQLSEHTVKLHIHNIISKLGATNRTEAAQWFHGPRAAASGAADERA